MTNITVPRKRGTPTMAYWMHTVKPACPMKKSTVFCKSRFLIMSISTVKVSIITTEAEISYLMMKRF
ncbi:hypothetical protein [Clostridium transplantifaecale]|uniref:hypothetical protein n=1 Tax=Clostridium transplantifaecale TaxID=2479838 RepID=UPI001FA9D70E|nr:hypothetical protein [Clostridium transplantifaecale]